MNSSKMTNSESNFQNMLSDEQQTLIKETLSQYKVEELSQSDAKSIVEVFSQAGIQPGKALEQAMAEQGYDAKNVGQLAGVGERGHPPPPANSSPMQSDAEVSSIVSFVTTLMEEKYASNNNNVLTDEDRQSILQQVFEKFGYQGNDSIINTSA